MKGTYKIKIFRISLVLNLTVILVFGGLNSTAVGEGNEYNIKAMFVLNFIKYIEWPEEVNREVYRIGVVGETEMYNALQSITLNRQENKKIVIEKIGADAKENYHIIIISKNENKRIDDWARRFQSMGTLVISDECKNCSSAAINLLNIDNKIRFEVNTKPARTAGIKISSKLTELAVSVKQ